MTKTWFSAAAKDRVADIAIYDSIGFWGVTAGDFRNTLTELGQVDKINLRINSPGGEAFAGIAIHNMLARHPAYKTVTVDGMAASAASFVAMAGDKIVMPENAMMMVHNPFGAVVGTADDMEDMASALRKLGDGMVTTYAARTGLDREAVVAIMDAETWLTAAEAKEQGFADEVVASAQITNKFDLSRYANPPKAFAAAETENEETEDEKPDPAVAETAEPDPLEAGIAEAREQMANIAAVCKLAGMPERTQEMIESGKTLQRITSELQALKADRSRGGEDYELSPRHINPIIAERSDPWAKTLGKINSKHA